MNRTFKRSLATMAVSAALVAPAAHATNGYFKIGYGSHNRGVAGAGVAFGQDAMAGVVNPATILDVGNRADAGIELFNPNRDASLDATLMGGGSASEDSAATLFAIPHGGMVMQFSPTMAIGITMAANGGMSTRYNDNVYFNAFGPAIGATTALGGPSGFAGGLEGAAPALNVDGAANDPNPGNGFGGIDEALIGIGGNGDVASTLGVNLSQIIIAPTVSYKLNENHAIGASLQVAAQRFRAYGIGLFEGFSSAPGYVTNNGDDESYGLGVKLGWRGKLTDSLTVGVSAASKIYMQEFDSYKGLFAEQGDFDIPATYAVGLAYQASDKLAVLFDVQRILYGDVAAISNPGPTAAEFVNALVSSLSYGGMGAVSNPLGTDSGWGFGWDDITVYKLGFNYDYNEQWTLRAGINHGDNPIDDKENLFNILAPGVVETHLTLGFSYRPTDNNEVTVAYMHAFNVDQTYTYTTPNPLGGPDLSYTAGIGMDQNALEVSYAWKF